MPATVGHLWGISSAGCWLVVCGLPQKGGAAAAEQREEGTMRSSELFIGCDPQAIQLPSLSHKSSVCNSVMGECLCQTRVLRISHNVCEVTL